MVSNNITSEKNSNENAWQAKALFRLSADLVKVIKESDVCQKVVEGLNDSLGYDFIAIFLDNIQET